MADRSTADPFDFLEQQLDFQAGITLGNASPEAMWALAERDGERAAELVLKVESGADQDKALLMVLRWWRGKNPDSALEWLRKQPGESLPATSAAWIDLFEDLSRSAPADVQRWMCELPPGELRSQVGQALARSYGRNGKVAEAMRLFQEFGGEDAPPEPVSHNRCYPITQ
jgi:pentatricopeptide repeat protein